MKKFLVFAVIFVGLLLSKAHGQESKWKVGIAGSGDLTVIWGNQFAKDFANPSFNFSGEFNFMYQVKPNLYLRSGLGFSRKGSQAKVRFTDVNGTYTGFGKAINNFDYVIIPLLLQQNFALKKVSLFLNGGLYSGFLMQRTSLTKPLRNDPNSVSRSRFNYTSLNKRYDFGLSFGLGTEIPLSNKISFLLEVRNNIGLVNISRIPVFLEGKLRHNSTNLMVGVLFNLGKAKD